MKLDRPKLQCSKCKKALRYDKAQKALVCKTAGCPKKGQAGEDVHKESES